MSDGREAKIQEAIKFLVSRNHAADFREDGAPKHRSVQRHLDFPVTSQEVSLVYLEM